MDTDPMDPSCAGSNYLATPLSALKTEPTAPTTSAVIWKNFFMDFQIYVTFVIILNFKFFDN
jgi:hypothetical protein